MKNKSIKNWAMDERPREKLVEHGATVLSNAEILAILIGSGNRQESAVELSRRLLTECDDSLMQLAKKSLADLTSYKGIGLAKAVNICSAIELGRRLSASEWEAKSQFTCSDDVFQFIGPLLRDLTEEEFWVLMLNPAKQLIQKTRIAVGGMQNVLVDKRVLFKKALDCHATSLILIHNHPSGNIRPSKSDLTLTDSLKKAGEIMDIKVIDHLITGINRYFSFADEGLL